MGGHHIGCAPDRMGTGHRRPIGLPYQHDNIYRLDLPILARYRVPHQVSSFIQEFRKWVQ
jgi:hypothetical protein